jgi:hypothetical protein
MILSAGTTGTITGTGTIRISGRSSGYMSDNSYGACGNKLVRAGAVRGVSPVFTRRGFVFVHGEGRNNAKVGKVMPLDLCGGIKQFYFVQAFVILLIFYGGLEVVEEEKAFQAADCAGVIFEADNFKDEIAYGAPGTVAGQFRRFLQAAPAARMEDGTRLAGVLAAAAPVEAHFFSLGGRPRPGTLRMASRAEGSYIAVGPEYDTGLIPALSSLFFAALGFMPKASPISLASNPFGIFIFSEYSTKIINNFAYLRQILYERIVKIREKSKYFRKTATNILTNSQGNATIKT